MRTRVFVAIACLVVSVAGCREELQPNAEIEANRQNDTTVSEEHEDAHKGDLAEQLVGMHFISKEEHEIGVAPPGQGMGHWHLWFHKDFVSWQFSDIAARPRYTVEADGTIKTPAGLGNDPPIEGKFFPERGELLWDGLWYRKAD